MENIERTNTVIYKLYSKVLGTENITEPEGWNEDVRSLERDKDSKAILQKIEIDLKFFGSGASYLRTIYNSFGISEKVLITKYEKSLYSLSEDWKVRYVQEIDMASYKEDERTGEVTVKATEGGLYYDIKNRVKDDYDLLVNESADGKDIGELPTQLLQPRVRDIFVESLFDLNRSGYSVSTSAIETGGYDIGDEPDQHFARTLPLTNVFNSDSADVYEPIRADNTYNGGEDFDYRLFEEQHAFFYRAEQDKTIRVRLEGTFTIDSLYERNSRKEKFYISFVKGGIDEQDRDVQLEREVLWEVNNVKDNIGASFTLNPGDFDREIFLQKGESLAFHIEVSNIQEADGGILSGTSKARIRINSTGELRVQDTTEYSITINKCIKPYDLFDRLIAKITGHTGLFRSSLFEEGGKYENYVVDNGFWARGFPDSYTEDEKEVKIQFKTSFQDAFDAFSYIEPLCWYVDYEGNQQVIRVESAKHTLQNFIGVELPAVDKIDIQASDKDYFSTIEIGHEGSLEYEEINGLDEYNGKSEFNSYLTRSEQKYTVSSPYRFDSIGYELIRRKPFRNYPKEDTDRDEDIWIHDCKFISRPIFLGLYIDVYTHNNWVDLGHDQAPTGIYGADSAWNLRLTPMNVLREGHGYSIIRGLYHKKNEYLRFSSSKSNQNLVTYKNGEEVSESGKIQIKNIDKNKVQATKVNLTIKMTQELEDQFLGFTKVGDKRVPNYFGLIKYKINGQDQFGRLVKLSGGGDTKLELIKAGL